MGGKALLSQIILHAYVRGVRRAERQSTYNHSRDTKESGLANLEQGTSCHVKTHRTCLWALHPVLS